MVMFKKVAVRSINILWWNGNFCRGGSRNLGRGGGGGGAEALSNIALLTHIHNEKIALIT